MTTTQRRGPGSRAGGNHPTRLEILDAATVLAERDGMDALTVAAITASAGHSKGTFYVHFEDRTALIVELHRRFHEDLFASIADRTSDITIGTDRAWLRIEAFLNGCRAQPAVRAMLLEARSMPEIAQLVAERNDQAARVLAAELREVSAQPREAAVLLVSATIEVALQELTAGKRLPRYRAALRNLIPSSAQSRPRR